MYVSLVLSCKQMCNEMCNECRDKINHKFGLYSMCDSKANPTNDIGIRISIEAHTRHDNITTDVRYTIFLLLLITIIAHIFYHDTIIITIYIPSLSEQHIDIGDMCNTEALNYNRT